MPSLGTVWGNIRMNFGQAIAAYAAVRAANASTVSNLNRMIIATGAAGRGMLKFGGLALAGIGVAVNAAQKFEKTLDHFGAVTNATQQDMEAVRQKALQLGRDSAYGAQQVAEAFVELGKAGVPAKDIINGVGDAVVQLAAAGDIPMSKAATVIVNMLDTFKLKAGDAVHVADVLAGAANASTIEIEDLAVSFKYVGGIASALSISIEDTAAAIGVLGNAGIRGSTAGTSLRQMLVSLHPTSKRAANVMKELGIITADGSNKFFDAQGHAKSLAEIFDVLHDATKGMSDEQRLAAFKIIFQNRALAAAIVLSRDGGKAIRDFQAQMSQTTALDVMNKRLDNLNGSWKKFKAAVQTALIAVGTPAQEPLKKLVDHLTDLVNWFSRLSPHTQSMIARFILWTGIIFTLNGALLLMVSQLLKLYRTFLLLREVYVFIRGLQLLTIAQRAFNAAALANPYVLIAAAIAALIVEVYLLWTNWDKVWGWISHHKGPAAVLAIIMPIQAGLVAAVGVWHWVWKNWDRIWNDMKEAPGKVWNAVTTFFGNLPGWVTGTLGRLSGAVIGWARGLPSTIMGALSSLGSLLARGVSAGFSAAITFFTTLPGKIINALAGLLPAVGRFLSQLPGRVGYFLGLALGTAIRWGFELIAKIIGALAGLLPAVGRFLSQLPGRIGYWLGFAIGRVIRWGAELVIAIGKAVVTAVSVAGRFFSRLPGNLARIAGEAYRGVINWIKRIGPEVGHWISNAVSTAGRFFQRLPGILGRAAQSAFNAVVDWFRRLPGRLAGIFGDIVRGALRLGGELLHAAGSAASNFYHGLLDGIRGLPGAVWGIIQQVIGAFKNVVGAAFNAAKDFAGGLWRGFKHGLGMKSPSYIEKAMDAIVANAVSNTSKLRTEVGNVNRAAGYLFKGLNPGGEKLVGAWLAINTAGTLKRAASAYQDIIAQVAKIRQDYLTGSTSILSTPFGNVVEKRLGANVQVGYVLNNNTYNPVAEPESRAVVTALDRLAHLGPSAMGVPA